MNVEETSLPGVLLVTPKVFGDARGFFCETYSRDRYLAAGIPQAGASFVQDNLSRSGRGTVRGLHLQNPHAQGKLVSVVEGTVRDVAVDVRVGSPSFGKSVVVELSAGNKRQLWVPPGFAHGFSVLTPSAIFSYKCTDLYHPEAEVGIAWNDPDLDIDWGVDAAEALVSAKDQAHPRLRDTDRARLLTF